MPSNTSHIQQRAQLQQFDDLVVPSTERPEWQDAQNELGLGPDFQSIGAPVRDHAVSSPPTPRPENLTAKQGPDSHVLRLRYICNCWQEMPKVQEPMLATQARYVR
jgi:hypothetical protein